MASDGDAWFSAEAIAFLEGTTERWARAKYNHLADQMDATERLWKRYADVPGGARVEFPFALLEPDTRAKLSDLRFEIGDLKPEGPGLPNPPSRTAAMVPQPPPQTDATVPPNQSPELSISLAGPSEKQGIGNREQGIGEGQLSAISRQLSVKALSLVPAALAETTIDLSAASQQLLPLDTVRFGRALARLPEAKRPLACARMRAIEMLIPAPTDPVTKKATKEEAWELWRGQTVHGIQIRRKGDFVDALALDSKFETRNSKFEIRNSAIVNQQSAIDNGQSVLVDWASINDDLRMATRDPHASITPLSATTIWRLLGFYEHGRPLKSCPACRGNVDQQTAWCQHCQLERRLPPGLEALQDLDRSDCGQIQMHPAHAEHLTALYLSGDSSVRHTRLALERPRTAAECLEILKLEIQAGELPSPPPSYYQMKRWINEALPRIVRDYARQGRQRALAQRGPYIPRRYSEDTAVNDCWITDFRRVDVRSWIDADERLYRIYLCAIMDAASRDVVFRFDLYPSAQLFKSTLRAALLRWGRPRDLWLDNGKEFTCEDIMGGATTRTWLQRVDCDDEALSLFDRLGISAHFAIKYNPNGKAELERFFHRFRDFELQLPGFTDSDTKKRPERLKQEELEHTEFCRGLRPTTPLFRIDKIVELETRFIEARHRHKPHSGYGMHRRTPAQVQAAFAGVREIPRVDELDILLWYRKTVRARGDKVCVQYNKVTFIFRADELLTLPGDCETEVHLDPVNADRALARLGNRWIELQPVNPVGERSPKEVADEIERKRHLEKQIRGAALLGSRLAPVPSPERYLQLLEADAARKQTALDGQRQDQREEVPVDGYAEAAKVVGAVREPPLQHPEMGSVEWTMAKLEKSRGGSRTAPTDTERVFTSKTEYEQWQARNKNT
jgi:hypothetical protein